MSTSATGGYLTPSSGAPATDTVVEDLFADTLVGVTGLAAVLVRPRWQPVMPKQPPADTNWIAFGVTETEPDAGPVLAHDPNAAGGLGADNYARHSKIAVLVTFYGPNGEGYANLVQDGLCVPQNIEFLRTNLITYVNSGTIRNVPEKINETWVRRWDLLLHFRRKAERVYPVENILSATVSTVTN